MATGFPAPLPIVIPSNGIITQLHRTRTYAITPTKIPVPYAETWNFAVQRSLPGNLALELAYVGNHAIGLSNTNV